MKLIKKIISIALVVAVVVGTVPAMSLNNGRGVYAATAKEIIDDALSWAVELDDYGRPKSTPIVDYVYGGLDLNVGVDCSGFVCAIFNRHGIDLVSMGIRSSYDMLNSYSKFGTKLDTTDVSAIKSGDILITNGGGHVGIAWVNGDTPMFIHSSTYGVGVVVQTLASYMRSSGLVAIIRPDGINGVQVNPIKGPGPLTTANYGDTTIGTKDDPTAFDINNPGAPFKIPEKEVDTKKADDVKWLQKALNNVDGNSISLTGVFGDNTKTALKKFQKNNGLSETGKADKATIDKLVSVYKKANTVTAIKLYLAEDDAKKYKTVEKKTEDVSNKADASSTGTVTAYATMSDAEYYDEYDYEYYDEYDYEYYDEYDFENIVADKTTDTSEKAATEENSIVDKNTGVKYIEVTSLTFNEDDTTKLVAKYTPDTAKNVTLTWSSSNKEVVTVNDKGEVTAIDGGKAVITVKTNNKISAKVSVIVKAGVHKEEWRNGKWYNAEGKQVYEPRGSWKSNSSGIWYEDTSGWYAVSEWVKIDGRWYYFNSKGYAYKNGWSQIGGTWYYFRSSGMMAENEWIGGYWLSKGGAWTYQPVGDWKKNNYGWWYEDTAGWYPKDETVKIDGTEYTFNQYGYMTGGK